MSVASGPPLVLVGPPTGASPWILDRLCAEVRTRIDGSVIVPASDPLPSADRHLFSHYIYFLRALVGGRLPVGARCDVIVTHLEAWKHRVPDAVVAFGLRRAATVHCMNQGTAERLIRRGVPRARVRVLPFGFDPRLFFPSGSSSTSGTDVGLCAAYYPRKSPERIRAVVAAMPHRRFRLLGRGWEGTAALTQLRRLPNFSYEERPYDTYPAFYRSLDIFVSLARLEGGPVPLIEAMACGIVPVATATGFAPDLIRRGGGGRLVPVDATVAEIVRAIEGATGDSSALSQAVAHCSWDSVAAALSGDDL